jgi:rhodanese-related sulfurtransferase
MSEFLSNNILLVAVFFTSAVMLIWPEIQRAMFGRLDEVSTHEATRLINQDAVVIDVRDHGEFAASHMPRAKNIPVIDLEKRLDEFQKHKEKPILLVCGNGLRSRAAARIFRKHAFAKVSALKGGFAEWQKAAMPVEK